MDNNVIIRKTKLFDITIVFVTLIGITLSTYLYFSYHEQFVKALMIGVFVYLDAAKNCVLKVVNVDFLINNQRRFVL